MLCTGSLHATAAAPAVSPAIFRKSRRSISGISSRVPALVVTGDAVVGRAAREVTLHAPAHLELRRRQEEAALGVAGLRSQVDALLVLDRTVALLALHARLDVAHVLELHVVGQVVDAHPRDRLVLVVVLVDLRDLLLRARSAPLLDVLVAAHADRDRRHRRVPAALGGAVAVEARDAEVPVLRRARVDLVVELDRLLGAGQLVGRVLVQVAGTGCEDHRAHDGHTDPDGGPLPRSHTTGGWLPAPRRRVKPTQPKSARCSKSLRRSERRRGEMEHRERSPRRLLAIGDDARERTGIEAE